MESIGNPLQNILAIVDLLTGKRGQVPFLPAMAPTSAQTPPFIPQQQNSMSGIPTPPPQFQAQSQDPTSQGRLKDRIETLLNGAIDAGATPNIAMGGPVDIFRAAQASRQGRRTRAQEDLNDRLKREQIQSSSDYRRAATEAQRAQARASESLARQRQTPPLSPAEKDSEERAGRAEFAKKQGWTEESKPGVTQWIGDGRWPAVRSPSGETKLQEEIDTRSAYAKQRGWTSETKPGLDEYITTGNWPKKPSSSAKPDKGTITEGGKVKHWEIDPETQEVKKIVIGDAKPDKSDEQEKKQASRDYKAAKSTYDRDLKAADNWYYEESSKMRWPVNGATINGQQVTKEQADAYVQQLKNQKPALSPEALNQKLAEIKWDQNPVMIGKDEVSLEDAHRKLEELRKERDRRKKRADETYLNMLDAAGIEHGDVDSTGSNLPGPTDVPSPPAPMQGTPAPNTAESYLQKLRRP